MVRCHRNWMLCETVAVVVCSPSDLDADFEDNQDYDSTVSQSETKLPMFIPSSRVDSVQEVESPTSAESLSAMRPPVSDTTELQRVTSDMSNYTHTFGFWKQNCYTWSTQTNDIAKQLKWLSFCFTMQ